MARSRKRVRKETYEPVGKHSAVQLCNWLKKSLKDEGVCFKEKFYGIKSHKCCQMTCSIFCNNRCIHCWRDITKSQDKMVRDLDNPLEILKGVIKAQRKLLTGFKIDPNSKRKQLSKANQKKLKEAQNPDQFAISLTGEPTLYPKIGELVDEIRKRKATSFLVTNGLQPEVVKNLIEDENLPTRLYVSVNSSNEKDHVKFHRSLKKNAWKKLNETLSLFSKLKDRSVFRINLIKGINMSEKNAKEFAQMVKKYGPFIVELKGYMSVGFARERLGYERMPTDKEMKEFIEKMLKYLKETEYKFLDEHERSRAYVLGKKKSDLKIKESEY